MTLSCSSEMSQSRQRLNINTYCRCWGVSYRY